MGTAVIKFERKKSSANWTTVFDVINDMTNDVQTFLSNSDLSAVNDMYMLGLVSSNITLSNTTNVVVTTTFDESLLANNDFMRMNNPFVDGDDTSSNQYKLLNVGYTYSTANIAFSNGHSYTIENNVFTSDW